MARPREHDGVVHRRPNTRILCMCYFDQSGERIRESTFTEDWQEANKKLRERLGAPLDIIVAHGLSEHTSRPRT